MVCFIPKQDVSGIGNSQLTDPRAEGDFLLRHDDCVYRQESICVSEITLVTNNVNYEWLLEKQLLPVWMLQQRIFHNNLRKRLGW